MSHNGMASIKCITEANSSDRGSQIVSSRAACLPALLYAILGRLETKNIGKD